MLTQIQTGRFFLGGYTKPRHRIDQFEDDKRTDHRKDRRDHRDEHLDAEQTGIAEE